MFIEEYDTRESEREKPRLHWENCVRVVAKIQTDIDQYDFAEDPDKDRYVWMVSLKAVTKKIYHIILEVNC